AERERFRGPAAWRTSPRPVPPFGCAEPVAEAADRLDQLAGVSQLAPEPLYMHVHSPGLDIGLRLPHGLEQLWSALHSPASLKQSEKQLVLSGGERQLPAVDGDAVRRAIDRHRSGRQGGSGGHSGRAESAKQGGDPERELLRGKGLGEIVVGAQREPPDAIGL